MLEQRLSTLRDKTNEIAGRPDGHLHWIALRDRRRNAIRAVDTLHERVVPRQEESSVRSNVGFLHPLHSDILLLTSLLAAPLVQQQVLDYLQSTPSALTDTATK